MSTPSAQSPRRRTVSGSRALLLMALAALALCAVVYLACARLISGGKGRPVPVQGSP